MPSRKTNTGIPLDKFFKGRGHRRWKYTAVTLLIALVLILADRSGLLLESGDDITRYDGKTFTVVRVIDGDTLDIDAPDGREPTTRLRLWGVDTPEMARRDPPKPAEPYAEAATTFTRRLAEGQTVRLILEESRTRGDYGRLLAFVELPDGLLLNEELISTGLSPADDRWSHRHIDRFDAAERRARDLRIGIWSGN